MGIKQLSDKSLQAQTIICMGVRTLAHLVRYDGEDLAPSVTFKVGSGGGAVNRPDDVMLVSTLLNWNYNNAKRLPRGATRLVVAGPKFTPEMKLFLTDAQSFYNRPSKATYGIAEPASIKIDFGNVVELHCFSIIPRCNRAGRCRYCHRHPGHAAPPPSLALSYF